MWLHSGLVRNGPGAAEIKCIVLSRASFIVSKTVSLFYHCIMNVRLCLSKHRQYKKIFLNEKNSNILHSNIILHSRYSEFICQ